MQLQHDRQITISAAGSRKATQWPAQLIWWSDFVARLAVPVRGEEALAEYMRLPKSRQDDLKDVGGFVGGRLAGERRKAANVLGRDLLTLDLDNIQAEGTDDVLRAIDGLGCAYAVYSTRKHSAAAPRLRIILPAAREMTADEYEPVARKMAEHIGIERCDPSTFEAARLMYWPSCSRDSQYVYTYGDRPMLDVDGVLALYTDWHDVSQWPQVPGAEKLQQRMVSKQEDPTIKKGAVGAFCRLYDVRRAMDELIPGEYEPCGNAPDRYTYTGGSTTGGAVVYDDGLYLYSHHATDPCGGQLVNAFDLVRLHKFGAQDEEAKPGTPAHRLPSYAAMLQYALGISEVRAAVAQDAYDRTLEAFSDVPGLPDTAENKEWLSQLDLDGNGNSKKTIDNMLIVLRNDPLLKGKIALDEFAARGVATGALPWDVRTGQRVWSDNDDAGAQWYLEKRYGLSGKDKVMNALSLCAQSNRFNELTDYLRSLEWDGVPRVDTLLIDYLGAEDNVYTRAVMRKSLAAAVARAMAPGTKYDYMPIFAGPQGIGKSTFLRLLGKKWFSDSLQTFEGKEAAEMLQGTWINEIGELNGMSRSEVTQVKQHLSKTEDIYRVPYGRRTDVYPRRCVFFGTTNDAEFLRDRTGNRRFWPVDVGITDTKKCIFTELAAEVDQIWAEARVRWQLGEPLYLTGKAETISKAQQEEHRESNAKEGMIVEFLERPVPLDWAQKSMADRRMYLQGVFTHADDVPVEPRQRVCAAEIYVECFGGELRNMRKTDAKEINDILASLPGWKRDKTPRRFGAGYGNQRGFERWLHS